MISSRYENNRPNHAEICQLARAIFLCLGVLEYTLAFKGKWKDF
jgi:hypothetical protein